MAHVERKIAPLEIEAEALVGEFLRELGDVQGALAACDRALSASDPKVNPGVPQRAHAEVLRARAVLLRRVGRVREAVDAYVDAIAVFRKAGARRQEARVKNALAYAMFVQGRYEDAIALAMESIQIDLSIGGRFQLAKTLTNIGHAYFRLGDAERGKAYLARASDAHERYGDQDGRAETLVVSAEILVEKGEYGVAEQLLRDASALNAATNNAYDITHTAIVNALLARERRDPRTAIVHAVEARRAAEDHVLVAFHFYAEWRSKRRRASTPARCTPRRSSRRPPSAGRSKPSKGCEYTASRSASSAPTSALEKRCRRLAPQAAAGPRERAVDYRRLRSMNTIRDPRLRRKFAARPLVAALFDSTPVPHYGDGIASSAPAEKRPTSPCPISPSRRR